MSLICVVCGKVIVMNDKPDHYGVCPACPSNNLTKQQREKMNFGNFDLGECFCDVKCIHGHKTRMFNLGRAHYVACDTCRSYIAVGANLMSCWRQENKDIWQANYDSVKGYKFIE